MPVCVAESREVLHKQDVEKVLVELLSVADIKVKSCTCQAVAAMSLHLASKDSFRDLGTYATISWTTTMSHSAQQSLNELYFSGFQVLSLQLCSC